MYELRVAVTKVLGACTADPPMKRGDAFVVRDGNISIPDGGYICLRALQSLLPVITPKEREICEQKDEDWMWRVHHVQCPDPDGRVIFKIEQVRKLTRSSLAQEPAAESQEHRGAHDCGGTLPHRAGKLRNLRVEVQRVNGTCTSGMKPGDHFLLRSGRLYIPPGRHFCLYALHAVLPLLPAKQRRLDPGDWMANDHLVICPDPAGNVIMRIGPDVPD